LDFLRTFRFSLLVFIVSTSIVYEYGLDEYLVGGDLVRDCYLLLFIRKGLGYLNVTNIILLLLLLFSSIWTTTDIIIMVGKIQIEY